MESQEGSEEMLPAKNLSRPDCWAPARSLRSRFGQLLSRGWGRRGWRAGSFPRLGTLIPKKVLSFAVKLTHSRGFRSCWSLWISESVFSGIFSAYKVLGTPALAILFWFLILVYSSSAAPKTLQEKGGVCMQVHKLACAPPVSYSKCCRNAAAFALLSWARLSGCSGDTPAS